MLSLLLLVVSGDEVKDEERRCREMGSIDGVKATALRYALEPDGWNIVDASCPEM